MLADVVANYDFDWTTAEREYRRAIELNPNDAGARGLRFALPGSDAPLG